jgi:hypothetical protein
MKRLTVAITLALCVALPASAQLYKWVDANGKVQYSDKPPPSNVKTEKLREPARPAAPAPAPSETKGGAANEAAKEGAANEAVKGAAPKAAAKSGPKTAAEQEQAFRKRQLEASKAQQEQNQKETEAQDRAENCRRAKVALSNLELGGRQRRLNEKGERVYLDDQEIAQSIVQARKDQAAACN